jgi:hypothetical protein
VKDEPYHLQQRDWLLLKPGVRHSTQNHSSADFANISIHFELDDPGYEKFRAAIINIENWVRMSGPEPSLELLTLPDPQPQDHEYSSHEAEIAHRLARQLEAKHSEYLSIVQIRKAKELIIHTPMTIEEIAIELGFASLSHFSRQFKRWTGFNPQQFRLHRLVNITFGQKVR